MIVRFKEKHIYRFNSLISGFSLKSDLGIYGYKKLGRLEFEVPNEDFNERKILDWMYNGIEVNAYNVYLKVQINKLAEEVLAGLSFSTMINEEEETVQRTYGDLTTLQSGTDHRILYWQGSTSEISMNDLEILVNDPNCDVLSMNQLRLELSKEEYFIQGVMGEYVDPKILSYSEIDSRWEAWFDDFLQARTYMYTMMTTDGYANLSQEDKAICCTWRIVNIANNILSIGHMNATLGWFEEHKYYARRRRLGLLKAFFLGMWKSGVINKTIIDNLLADLNKNNFNDFYIEDSVEGSEIINIETGQNDAVGMLNYVSSTVGTIFENNGLAELLTGIPAGIVGYITGTSRNIILKGTFN